MSEKSVKLTRKDAFILLVGIFLAFAVQVAYDIAREIAYDQTVAINEFWLIAQFCYILIALFFAYLVLIRIE